jgi:hypothetical protein
MLGNGWCLMSNNEQPYQLVRLYGTVTAK